MKSRPNEAHVAAIVTGMLVVGLFGLLIYAKWHLASTKGW